MLFDLQGKRRRVVQATYLMLAVLMGGGLVLFGIGGDVSGGLFDAFSDRSGNTISDDSVEEDIERNEELAAKPGPRREAALQALVEDYFQLARSQTPTGATAIPEEARDELQKAARNWQRYVEVVQEKPDPDTALYALRIYDPSGLNDPAEAQKAAQIIAADDNAFQSYLAVVRYATLAGDTRTADLAGQKAIDLAPKADKPAVRAQVKLEKQSTPPPSEAGGE
jgi:hypothetical protein